MTETKIISTNFKPFKEVEKGEFFTDSENHFCYCIDKGIFVDFTVNELFDFNKYEEYVFYDNGKEKVYVHKNVEIKAI